ncbi:MAG: hypothetical protein ACR2PV_04895, partial [Gammaproteobacteria bacterium]
MEVIKQIGKSGCATAYIPGDDAALRFIIGRLGAQASIGPGAATLPPHKFAIAKAAAFFKPCSGLVINGDNPAVVKNGDTVSHHFQSGYSLAHFFLHGAVAGVAFLQA